MIAVREINSVSDLAALRLSWQALLPATPGATFFHSLDWLLTYWQHFGTGQRLRVLVVTSDNRPIGILPLVVKTRTSAVGSIRVLRYPLDDWASFYGPIGPNPTATLLAGLRHVRQSPRDWDVLELPWTDAALHDRQRTPRAMAAAGLSVVSEECQTSALVDLSQPGGFEAYWAERTSHWRTNVRRSEKRLAECGPVTYIRHRPDPARQGDGDPQWALYESCERLAKDSWQGSSQTGTTLTHESIRPFLRDCHAVAAHCGALDMNLLLVDSRPVAFNYAYHYRGSIFGLRMGFDRSVQGAGSVLQARMIADSFARGDHTYDLGPGYLNCKRHWQTHTSTSLRYIHFAPQAPRAQLARFKRSVNRVLKATGLATPAGAKSLT